MSFTFDERWPAAGWVPCVASVERNRVGREDRPAWKHSSAPGLVVHASLDNGEWLSITHVLSGLNAGLLSWQTWTPCPVALRDALSKACEALDYESLTAENAPYVDKDKLNSAKKAVDPLHGHKCEVCIDYFDAGLDEEIELAEADLQDAESEVERCYSALHEAEEDVKVLRKQLADLLARKNAKEAK
jgi:hypothetical protein